MDKETKQVFAARTKTLRKERGLSQTELAAALDISRTSVNLYESASRVPEKLKKGWEIVISPDGDDTIAKLYEDGSLAQVDVVSRYYKDEYSVEVAAKEAVKKLFEPHRFTGKAMFVGANTDGCGFTRGKIYQFTDGNLIDDNGNKRPYDKATTLEGDDWYSQMFVKVVE